MAEDVYRTSLPVSAPSNTAWGAIFAGTFAALSVWATFGALGLAIFASNANPNAPRPLTGMPVGEGFWIVILSMIALYVGARVATALAGVTRKVDGVMHGLVVFGMSTFAAILITYLLAMPASGNGISEGVRNASLLTTIAGGGYILFIALLLSACTAMWGGTHGLPRGEARVEAGRPDIRRVA